MIGIEQVKAFMTAGNGIGVGSRDRRRVVAELQEDRLLAVAGRGLEAYARCLPDGGADRRGEAGLVVVDGQRIVLCLDRLGGFCAFGRDVRGHVCQCGGGNRVLVEIGRAGFGLLPREDLAVSCEFGA